MPPRQPPRGSQHLDKNFFFKFEPAVYLADDNLQLCSYAACGLWTHILCVMFSRHPRGTIPGDHQSLRRLLPDKDGNLNELIQELEEQNVFSRAHEITEKLPPDTIINRRMFQEYNLAWIRSQNGKKGGRPRKNPEKLNESKPLANAKAKLSPEQKQTQKQNSSANPATATPCENTEKLNEKLNPGDEKSKTESTSYSNSYSKIKKANKKGFEEAQENEPSRASDCVAGFMQNLGEQEDQENQENDNTEEAMAPSQNPEHWQNEITRATQGTFTWRAGHVKRLQKILGHPQGWEHIEETVRRVDLGKDPSRDLDEIKNPAAFVNSELTKLIFDLRLDQGTE